MRGLRVVVMLVWLVAWAGGALATTAAAPGSALLLEVQGVIGPASRDFILRGFERAS